MWARYPCRQLVRQDDTDTGQNVNMTLVKTCTGDSCSLSGATLWMGLEQSYGYAIAKICNGFRNAVHDLRTAHRLCFADLNELRPAHGPSSKRRVGVPQP